MKRICVRSLSGRCLIESLAERALLALQGPRAEDVLAALAPEVRDMHFMDVRVVSLLGEACIVSRSGYTGEDGFEISIHATSGRGAVRGAIARSGGCAGRPRRTRQPAARSRTVPLRLRSRRGDHAGRGGARMDDSARCAAPVAPCRRLSRSRNNSRSARKGRHTPACRAAAGRTRPGAWRSPAIRSGERCRAGRDRDLWRVRA